MKITKLPFFVFSVSNIARAREFYEDVLQLRASRIFEKDGNGVVDYDIGGARLMIVCGGHLYGDVKPGGMVAMEADTFSEVLAHLRARKVNFETAPVETSESQHVIVSDADGNRVIIHKMKGPAKKGFVVI